MPRAPEAGIHIPMPRRIAALAGLLAVCVVAGALVAPTVHAQTATPQNVRVSRDTNNDCWQRLVLPASRSTGSPRRNVGSG